MVAMEVFGNVINNGVCTDSVHCGTRVDFRYDAQCRVIAAATILWASAQCLLADYGEAAQF